MITALKNFFHHKWCKPQGYRDVLYVGLPLIIGMSSTTLMQFIDRIFLSNYSVDAIAASMPSYMAYLCLFLIVMGTCSYTTVIIAQYVGSNSNNKVGVALWQGIWSACIGGILLANLWWFAEPLFQFAGHAPNVQRFEIDYFRVLTLGSIFALLNSVLSCFFSGRGKTHAILFANITAALIKTPIDYVLIFGHFNFPELGIIGAGISTVTGSAISATILAFLIFTKKNELIYRVRTGWRLKSTMLFRLMRFGIPSGLNYFADTVTLFWFSLEVGTFGTSALAASNIAFSINSLLFLPMLGLNLAIASLVGQSIGRGRLDQVKEITTNSLQLALIYMIPLALIMVVASGGLMELFAPRDLAFGEYTLVKNIGIILLCYIALYSLADTVSITYLGALKGAGDTFGILCLFLAGVIFFLVGPIFMLKYLNKATLHGYWIAFTVYVFYLAVAAYIRFKTGVWKTIKVVESTTVIDQS